MSKRSKTGVPGALLILAAGLGKRMKSELPKVLHEVCGEPMLVHLLRSVKEATPPGTPIAIVVGHGREKVESTVLDRAEFSELKLDFIFQSEQKGTGHAVRSAMESAWGKSRVAENAEILVLPGDLPLISSNLISEMVRPLSKSSKLRALTCRLSDPTGYGRVIRKGKSIAKIVEEKDASESQKKINEVVASIYSFESNFLSRELPKLKTKNAQGEYYLTDVVAAAKGKSEVLNWSISDDVRGVNDLWELTLAEKIFQRRIVEKHARAGVRFLDTDSVAIESGVTIGVGVKIHRGVVLRGKTSIGAGSDIGSNCVLRSVKVGERVEMKAGCYCQDSEIGDQAKVGPYAHLRPGSFIGREAKIGNFVEIKKSQIGEKTSVAHLSYVGDATIGAQVNIGCGFITCNYDGKDKHQTIIEDDAFVGSDVQVVAPLKIGRGAYIASGSTLTMDVPGGDLAIARTRQVNKTGYAKKFGRKQKDS